MGLRQHHQRARRTRTTPTTLLPLARATAGRRGQREPPPATSTPHSRLTQQTGHALAPKVPESSCPGHHLSGLGGMTHECSHHTCEGASPSSLLPSEGGCRRPCPAFARPAYLASMSGTEVGALRLLARVRGAVVSRPGGCAGETL